MKGFDQSRIIEQAKFTCSPLGKASEKKKKNIKTVEDQGIQQAEALKAFKSDETKQYIKSIVGIFPKEMRTNEIENEIDEIKKWEEKIKRKDLKYEPEKYTYGF